MQLTGAEIIVECLKEQGVDTVFGYPGGAILNVYDALYEYKDQILGIAIPFLINLSIRKAFPVLYHIPWAALFGGIFVLIGIVFFITRTEIHKLRDKSIIDEIRMDIV